MDRHLGQTSDGIDEGLFKSVYQNVERLSEAIVEAEADRYSSTNRERHDEVIERLAECLRSAEAELARLEDLRANRERVEEFRAKWVDVADGYLVFRSEEKPSQSEMAQIYRDLSVAFQFHTSPHSFTLKQNGSILQRLAFLSGPTSAIGVIQRHIGSPFCRL